MGINTDRLLHEVERRLANLGEAQRQEVLDALREEIARERRRMDPPLTVESERERRVEAETLREVLEAINRQARLEDTIEEVLKQLSRIVALDYCSIALLEPDGRFRIIAARGEPESASVLGATFRDALADEIVREHRVLSLADTEAEPRFVPLPGLPPVRSWAGIPLLVEGEVIGLLRLGRERVDPFEEEELHRAKAVAFSAAANIRKAKLLEQVRRYATLLEQVVAIDQRVFEGAPPDEVARLILAGASHVGNYGGGMLIVQSPRGPVVAAAQGDGFVGTEGRLAPGDLGANVARRLKGSRLLEVAEALGTNLPTQELYLVPLSTPYAHVGTLALLDPSGESADDQLLESYASRAAAAYLHAARGRP
jgi:hypothetical protein